MTTSSLEGPVDQLDGGALFGAAAYAGAFAPGAVVAVDGLDVAAGSDTAAVDGLMVVDGLSVTWGRDDVLDQPTPAQGRLVLFDPTRTWATRADRRGRPVTIRYAGTSDLDGTPVSAVFFRGRIGSPVIARARDVWRALPDGRRELVRGAVVELSLQSAVVDLANLVPRVAWPAETMGARVNRVVAAAQAAGHLTGGANLRDFWETPNVAPVAAVDQVSLLDHLTALFNSAGADRYTYRPDTDALDYVPRRNITATATMGRLVRATTGPRANQGAYVRARNVLLENLSGDTAASTGLFLDSGTLEYDPADGITTPARITRVAISHPDEAAGYATRTVEIPVRREPWDPDGGSVPLDERVLGVRTARYESQVAWNAWADTALSDTEFMVRREGSRWLLEPLRITTRKLGGFHAVDVAQFLLAGYERNDLVFLQRSFTPSMGIRPVYGVMGGTIRYERGGWDVDFVPAPITTTIRQHSLTWENLNTTDPTLRIKAWDGPHPEGFDATVTFEDLRFVGMGLDGIDPPASSRDEYQA